MSKKIKFSLSQRSIQQAIKELKEYQNDLNRKCEILCERLIAEGLQVAEGKVGDSGFGKYIHIGSEITPEKAGCKAVLFMRDKAKITSEWQTLEGVRNAEVSPMLMIEFGSGLKAQNPMGIDGVGTGTFGEHGNEPGWWYMDLEGNWHYSTGVSPKMPMFYARKEIREKVIKIAKEVFG